MRYSGLGRGGGSSPHIRRIRMLFEERRDPVRIFVFAKGAVDTVHVSDLVSESLTTFNKVL